MQPPRVTLPSWAFNEEIIVQMITQLDDMILHSDPGTSVEDVQVVINDLLRMQRYIKEGVFMLKE